VPESCLKITETEVLLWEVAIKEPCFAISLRFWHAWRERLARPDQRRLYRKFSNGANQDSYSPDPTALPWAEHPCTTLCGDWAW
jgi:hypothetical protein